MIMMLFNERFGVGDSYYFENIINFQELNQSDKEFFDTLKSEIKWYEMKQKSGLVPRLVSIQGKVEYEDFYEDSKNCVKSTEMSLIKIPFYRHPVDQYPPFHNFSPLVLFVKTTLESSETLRKYLSVDGISTIFNFNHVLIQYYRSGHDYISEHADKTIDVLRDSFIVNVSFGVSRNFILKPKKLSSFSSSTTGIENMKQQLETTLSSQQTCQSSQSSVLTKQKLVLANNSLFVLGWDTNRYYLHSLPQQKSLTVKASSTQSKTMTTMAEDTNNVNNESANNKTSHKANNISADSDCYNGERISLTFRSIATYLRQDGVISGQGAGPPTRTNITTATAAVTTTTTQQSEHSLLSVDSLYAAAKVKDFYTENLYPTDVPVCLNLLSAKETNNSNIKDNIVNNIKEHANDEITPPQLFYIKYKPVHTDNNSDDSDIDRESSYRKCCDEKIALLEAFRQENQVAGIEWESIYARGFTVW